MPTSRSLRRTTTKAVALALLLTLGWAGVAGAQTVWLDQWYLSANGSVHCVFADFGRGPQFVCDKQTTPGNYVYGVLDLYQPQWMCGIGSVTSGNGAGDPLRIRFIPPYGPNNACLLNGYSAYNGWTNGQGYSEGQAYWNGNYVSWTNWYYVFPRDSNRYDAYGSVAAIY